VSEPSDFFPGLIVGGIAAGLLAFVVTAGQYSDRALRAFSEGRMVTETTTVKGKCAYWLDKSGGVFVEHCEGDR
jgi:hypothetical protein